MCTKNYDQMVYASWDMVRDECNYFLLWAIFCPFTPVTSQKIKILKKMIKSLEISSFYICVPKIMIRWCMLPEIWCVMNVIIFLLWAILCPFTPETSRKNKILKKMKKTLEISSFYICVPQIMIRSCTVPEIWCVTDLIVISHFGLFFALFHPHPTPKHPKKSKFWKKKKPGDIIILHKCTKNYDQMMYSSWDMVHDGQTDKRTEEWHKRGECPT